jgi:hypothetical protein
MNKIRIDDSKNSIGDFKFSEFNVDGAVLYKSEQGVYSKLSNYSLFNPIED